MSLITPAEMTKLFLYGSTTVPNDKANPSLIRPENPAPGTYAISVNLQDFMEGPGRFATAEKFFLLHLFFDSSHNIPVGQYDELEIRQYFESLMTPIDVPAAISITQSLFQDGTDDYAERTFLWNNTSFEIDEGQRDAAGQLPKKFVVTATGDRYVDDFAIVPLNFPNNAAVENFDLEGGDITSHLGNQILRDWIDPSNIGRRVDVFFDGAPSYTRLTQQDYQDIVNNSVGPWLPDVAKLFADVEDIADSLFGSGITSFESSGRAVVYASAGGDAVVINAAINSYHENMATNSGVIFVGDDNANVANALLSGRYETEFRGLAGADEFDVLGGASRNTLDGGEGEDFLRGGRNKDLIYGREHDDVIRGGWEGDTIWGGWGSDNIRGGAGNDVICGSEDDGTSLAGDSDLIFGGSGADEICIEGDGQASLSGGSGDDTLRGNGRSTLEGGSGADEFHVTSVNGSYDEIRDPEGHDELWVNGVQVMGNAYSELMYAYDTAPGLNLQPANVTISTNEPQYYDLIVGLEVIGLAADFSGSYQDVIYRLYVFQDITVDEGPSVYGDVDGYFLDPNDAVAVVDDFRLGDFGIFPTGPGGAGDSGIIHNTYDVLGKLTHGGVDYGYGWGHGWEYREPRTISEEELERERAFEETTESDELQLALQDETFVCPLNLLG